MPQAHCAATLMLLTFLSMMPSMAVVDGSPVALDPLADSVCPDAHR